LFLVFIESASFLLDAGSDASSFLVALVVIILTVLFFNEKNGSPPSLGMPLGDGIRLLHSELFCYAYNLI